MAKTSYTDEDKEKAHALKGMGLANREIARRLGIPSTTVYQWIRDMPEAVRDECEQMRTAKKQEFITSAWEVIGKSLRLVDKRITRALEHEEALDEMVDIIENRDMTDKHRQALIAKVRALQLQNVRELSTLIGTMYDKAALAMGDSTSNVNTDMTFTFERLPEGIGDDDIMG